jgi:hypothetical protein
MKLWAYQLGELLGILFLLASTATQIFHVEPLNRQIEWRLAAFSIQQNGQIQADTIYWNRIALLRAANAAQSEIDTAQSERDKLIEKYKTADANVANYVIDKEWIESTLQLIVVGMFAIGSLLAGLGRAMEMGVLRQIEWFGRRCGSRREFIRDNTLSVAHLDV